MKIARPIPALFLLVCALFAFTPANAQLQAVGDGGPGPVKAQHLTVELVSLAPGIAPGGKLNVGLVFTLEEHWHVYWINAGDAGEPPKITWTLPDRHHCWPNAVSHSQPSSQWPPHGLRLRR